MTNLLIRNFVKNYENIKDPKVRAAYGKLAGIIGIILNIILFIIKIIVGTLSASVSVTADAVNNLSDASSSIISLIGFKLSEIPADINHPYGHGRYEYLAALTVAVLIILIGAELLKTSFGKIINPENTTFSLVLVTVLIISMLVKLWMMIFNKKTGEKINSKALIATSKDSRNDVITTAAVLVGAVISYYTDISLDGFIGLAVAVFILISGFGLIKETIDPLLGCAPDEEYLEYIKNKIMSHPEILGMHDLMVHDYGPMRKFASVHVEMAAEEDVMKTHGIIDYIERDFLENDGLHMIVHFDPIITKDDEAKDIRKQIEKIVKKINSLLSIHDLRVVRGENQVNIIFDCVSPKEAGFKEDELKKLINEKVKSINSTYNCVISVDNSFAPIQK